MSPGDAGGVGDASIVAIGEGGLGVRVARVIVVVVMGRGVVGQVVVVVSLTQVVGLWWWWVGSWSWSSRH